MEAMSARNENLEVPVYLLKAKQGCAVRKKIGKDNGYIIY
jgi:hypothetical protein